MMNPEKQIRKDLSKTYCYEFRKHERLKKKNSEDPWEKYLLHLKNKESKRHQTFYQRHWKLEDNGVIPSELWKKEYQHHIQPAYQKFKGDINTFLDI